MQRNIILVRQWLKGSGNTYEFKRKAKKPTGPKAKKNSKLSHPWCLLDVLDWSQLYGLPSNSKDAKIRCWEDHHPNTQLIILKIGLGPNCVVFNLFLTPWNEYLSVHGPNKISTISSQIIKTIMQLILFFWKVFRVKNVTVVRGGVWCMVQND